MEVNINSDLGESSKFHSTENDPALLKIVNSANIACGYHAGDEETMEKTIRISKDNRVSIGSHPSYLDRENFGRKRMNISPSANASLGSNDSYTNLPLVLYEVSIPPVISKKCAALFLSIKPSTKK